MGMGQVGIGCCNCAGGHAIVCILATCPSGCGFTPTTFGIGGVLHVTGGSTYTLFGPGCNSISISPGTYSYTLNYGSGVGAGVQTGTFTFPAIGSTVTFDVTLSAYAQSCCYVPTAVTLTQVIGGCGNFLSTTFTCQAAPLTIYTTGSGSLGYYIYPAGYTGMFSPNMNPGGVAIYYELTCGANNTKIVNSRYYVGGGPNPPPPTLVFTVGSNTPTYGWSLSDSATGCAESYTLS